MKKFLLFIPLMIFIQLLLFSQEGLMGQGLPPSDNLLKSIEESDWASITLYAETINSKTSTQISYNENMKTGLDVGYDADFFTSNSELALYSRLIEDNGVEFCLQCLPAAYEDLVIPIGLDAKAGDLVSFSASSLDIPDQYVVILEDRILSTLTVLGDIQAKYTIRLSEDIHGIGRFFVRTSLKSTLSLGNIKQGNAFQIITRPVENILLIRGESRIKTKAKIYSITGNLVADIDLKKEFNNSIHFNENAGIYILQISNEKRTFTQKFFWVK